jgi:diaminopimelate epimerase
VRIEELRSAIVAGHETVILNAGNPQCAVFVPSFDFDWRALGAQLERHPRFPNRTNVSFIHVIDRHTLEARFFERGAGATHSSGTGSTGAAAAAVARGLAESPVKVLTPAGPLNLRWSLDDILLAGPAEIVARGEFYWNGTS